jgi:hypothetical protein
MNRRAPGFLLTSQSDEGSLQCQTAVLISHKYAQLVNWQDGITNYPSSCLRDCLIGAVFRPVD